MAAAWTFAPGAATEIEEVGPPIEAMTEPEDPSNAFVGLPYAPVDLTKVESNSGS